MFSKFQCLCMIQMSSTTAPGYLQHVHNAYKFLIWVKNNIVLQGIQTSPSLSGHSQQRPPSVIRP